MLTKNLLKSFDTFIFDLDGTFWWYPKVVDGGKEVYERLLDLNKNVIFVSNFTFLDRDGIVKTLKKNGIEVKKEQIITSSYVASKVLKNQRVYPIGKGLESELRKNGVKIEKSENANCVVIGHDINYNYQKGKIALKILLKGGKFYTTAYGRTWIFKNEFVPGTGLITAGLEYCSGKKPIMLGKPSSFMLKEVKKIVKGRVIYFGDEKVDVEVAKKSKFFPVFIKSGIDKKVEEKVESINSIKNLLKLF
ncbi:MAG: HAD-IIA family hydrolase [Candidatus Aenigmatarchaeota archaeon]